MRIGETWGSLRGIVRERLTFNGMKDLVGAAGLPVQRLAHLQQRFGGGATKGQLMDAIDGLVIELDGSDQDRFVIGCIEELLQRDADLVEQVEAVLRRVGWGLTDEGPMPLSLQIDLETRELSDSVRETMSTAMRRYRDGDTSGALTSICGAVDSATEAIYDERGLRDHKAASYQERVNVAFGSLENEYTEPLKGGKLTEDDMRLLWRNHRQAVNQAAYVLAAYRRTFSDAHGPHDAPRELVQRALDCGVFILRSLSSLL